MFFNVGSPYNRLNIWFMAITVAVEVVEVSLSKFQKVFCRMRVGRYRKANFLKVSRYTLHRAIIGSSTVREQVQFVKCSEYSCRRLMYAGYDNEL